ncbi:MAG: hypothetical protein CMK09_10000 [Ponticaulis sp.]|nr:hypothetical protein [Ponticaulis sp.]|tara:strand:- start:18787 stop:19086 length:300 start_codon:yes stop_codon:yes gene_type:complete
MKTTLVALVASAAILTPTALAEDSFPFVFEYDTASVQTEDGAREAAERLRSAVEAACKATMPGAKGVTKQRYENKCVQETLEDTLAKIENGQKVILAAN